MSTMVICLCGTVTRHRGTPRRMKCPSCPIVTCIDPDDSVRLDWNITPREGAPRPFASEAVLEEMEEWAS